MAYDMQVVNTAYATAQSMGVSDKVMLALFEAAIVESGFRNLNYGDRDSVGFLQQRPSQGWPNPMDVPTATRSFVNKAKPIESRYATAGMLAQAVQRSAFPGKYDLVAIQALSLLNQVRKTPGTTAPGFATQPVGITGATENIDKFFDTVTNPGTWKRVGIGMLGFFLFVVALVKLTGDNELGETSKTLMKVVQLVPGAGKAVKAIT